MLLKKIIFWDFLLDFSRVQFDVEFTVLCEYVLCVFVYCMSMFCVFVLCECVLCEYTCMSVLHYVCFVCVWCMYVA